MTPGPPLTTTTTANTTTATTITTTTTTTNMISSSSMEIVTTTDLRSDENDHTTMILQQPSQKLEDTPSPNNNNNHADHFHHHQSKSPPHQQQQQHESTTKNPTTTPFLIDSSPVPRSPRKKSTASRSTGIITTPNNTTTTTTTTTSPKSSSSPLLSRSKSLEDVLLSTSFTPPPTTTPLSPLSTATSSHTLAASARDIGSPRRSSRGGTTTDDSETSTNNNKLQRLARQQLQIVESTTNEGKETLPSTSLSSSARSLLSPTTSRRSRTPPSSKKQQPGNEERGGGMIIHRSDPDGEEQAMFEQRLCEDSLGVAVRKISHSGKSQLRYVRCVALHEDESKIADGKEGKEGGGNASLNRTANNSVVSQQSGSKSLRGRFRRKAGSSSGGGSYQEESLDTQNASLISKALTKRSKALTWGHKNRIVIPLERFTAVKKGKSTERTQRNSCPGSRLLSILTDDTAHPSLDIEAPTRLDRDKFARAFSRFLNVPLVTETGGNSGGPPENFNSAATVDFNASNAVQQSKPRKQFVKGGKKQKKERLSAAHTAPDTLRMRSPLSSASTNTSQDDKHHHHADLHLLNAQLSNPEIDTSKITTSSTRSKNKLSIGLLPTISPSTANTNDDLAFTFQNRSENKKQPSRTKLKPLKEATTTEPNNTNTNSNTNNNNNSNTKLSLKSGSILNNTSQKSTNITSTRSRPSTTRAITTRKKQHNAPHITDDDNISDVSSLTAGFDQEIVEELHQALTELRTELESSRAEAARAVKVAEQAIQSAESCTSNDWNSTVTHKAAEAAAQAQKRSAEAMARQRLAEERLASERRSAAFWRRQAEVAEEDAGALQTRAAASEVSRAAMVEELNSERQKTNRYLQDLKEDFAASETLQREALDLTMEQNRSLEIMLEGTRRDLLRKNEEAKLLQEALQERKSSYEHSKIAKEKKKKFSRIGRRKHRTNNNTYNETTSNRSRSASRDRSATLLLSTELTSSRNTLPTTPSDALTEDRLLTLQSSASTLRTEFEILKRYTKEELQTLPHHASDWIHQIKRTLLQSQEEIKFLRSKLSYESAMRRKLCHEVHDLRGTVRVFCRPKPCLDPVVDVPSHDTLVLHRDHHVKSSSPKGDSKKSSLLPISFEFDRVFPPNSTQSDLYDEMEELILGALDGYIVCLMAYGQTRSGKTHTLLGDYKTRPPPLFHNNNGSSPSSSKQQQQHQQQLVPTDAGMLLRAVHQLFTIAQRRQDRYQDSIHITILEVHGERLCDLIAGTEAATKSGEMQAVDPIKPIKKQQQHHPKSNDNNTTTTTTSQEDTTKPRKLEIRTNYDGDTIVQGLISIPITSVDDVYALWDECLTHRAAKLAHQGIPLHEHESSTHLITTLHVVSTNIATGVGTVGKIQFVDMAGADLLPKKQSSSSSSSKQQKENVKSHQESLLASVYPTTTSSSTQTTTTQTEWKFAHKSLATLSEVVHARCQYARSVPYRNSTLTHLLRDSLEGDAKVLLVCCISSSQGDLQETATALRFASRMRRVMIGKATKHMVSLA